MDTEKLKTANALLAQIDSHKEHLSSVTERIKRNNDLQQNNEESKKRPAHSFLLDDFASQRNGVFLRAQFMPIAGHYIMCLYVQALKNKIAELQAEFDAL